MIWLMPAPPVVVEPAAAEDLPDLADIHARAFAVGWSEDELHRLGREPAVTTLVARRGSRLASRRPVGFVMVRRAADEAEVLSIAVHPRRRGGGVGRALMEAGLRRLYADRARRVFLEVGADNAAALALYARLGFRQVGERPGYYAAGGGPPVTARVLALDLA